MCSRSLLEIFVFDSVDRTIYRKPLPNKNNGATSFSKQCIGINTLGRYMKAMLSEAGIDTAGRNIRNHSGKVTLCTRLYEQNYDEQAIM